MSKKMLKMKRSLIFTMQSSLILALTILPAPASSAAVNLPTTAFLPCSQSSDLYCIDSVSVTPLGESSTSLSWIPSGNPGPAVSKSEGVSGSTQLTGRWSADGAFEGENYDGLYLDVKQANAFVPWIFAEARPTFSPENSVKLAVVSNSPTQAVDLNRDIAISFKLRVANFEPGVTFGVGMEGAVNFTKETGYNSLEFSAYPVKVPLARSTRDCSGDLGKASALVTQLNTVFVPSNDDRGYGIQGSSGKLYVGSNGICKLSTPVWIAETKTFSYKASGPKLSPDGTEVNTGFYYASIPFADAKSLWGIENPQDAVSALIVSIRTNAGGSSGAIKAVSVKNQNILISVSGFEFPDPSIDVSLNPEYKPRVNPAANNNMSLAGGGAKNSTNKTITCVKGNKTKKVTAVKPKCPKGFKKS
jgi:hypothetical protein